MRKLFLRIVSLLNKILGSLSGILLMLLMIVGTIDVVARYLFDNPIRGALNLSEIILVGVVFFSWPYTQSIEGNVRVEIFSSKFRPKVQTICKMSWSLISIVILIIMSWKSAVLAMDSKLSYEIIDVVNIPAYPFKLFVTIGVGVLCLQLIADFITSLMAIRKV